MALRWLARRPLTEAELRGRFADKGFSDNEIERSVRQLIDEGLIDDTALASDYIVLRSRRMHVGRERLLRELKRRGVDGAVADHAWREVVDNGELDPEVLLRDAVTRRLRREGEPTAAARRRVYNALLRAGFPAAELYAEVGRQWPADGAEHGYHDHEGP